jgi:small subunit ribosomal protein S1
MVNQSAAGENIDMAQLLDEAESNYRTLQRGEVVDGVIMKVDRDGLLVNLGQKTEGVVPSREMRGMAAEDFDALRVGDSILVAVLRPETEEGQALLSLDRARGEQVWRKLQQLSDESAVIEAPVTGYNKGGAIVTVDGLQGFIPLSQLASISRVQASAEDSTPALAALVGKKLQVKVIEVNRRRNRAILSERAAVQESRQAQKQRVLDELAEGQVRMGRVSGITNFGVFVDLGGADGLVHISELSWEAIKTADEVVHVGQDVNVFVIKVDKENRRIALSLKRTRPEPWADLERRYQVGQVLPATITKLATFGAFARLEGAIEGLIHISELSERQVTHPKEVVREGDQVKVKIVRLDPERRRIGLSMKQITEPPEEEDRMPLTFTPPEVQGPDQPAMTQMAAELSRAFSRAQEGNKG